MKNFILHVNLSREEIKQHIRNMKSIIMNLDKEINQQVSVVIVTRRFMRLSFAPISMTIVIEEKDPNQCEVTIAMIGNKEGFWTDANAGKAMRTDLLKQIDSHVKSIVDVTPEGLNEDLF